MPFIASIILLLPSSPRTWAEAASFLHGVCSRDSTFQPIPLRSAPSVPSLA